MNAKTTLVLAALLAAVTARADDAQVRPEDLPEPVQKALRTHAEGPVAGVTRRTVGGRDVYVVEIERNNAPNPRLRIAEDGTLLSQLDPLLMPSGEVMTAPNGYPGVWTGAADYPRLKLSDLPESVQKTATTEAGGREIADIDRETWLGRPVYEVEFKERGLNSSVYIGEDGALVRDERRPGAALKSLFLGTQLEDTPVAVQEAIRRVAGSSEIADIDRESSGGQAFYRVEIGRGEARREVHVNVDGKILFDSRAPDKAPRG